jgi:hypothetical protein
VGLVAFGVIKGRLSAPLSFRHPRDSIYLGVVPFPPGEL